VGPKLANVVEGTEEIVDVTVGSGAPNKGWAAVICGICEIDAPQFAEFNDVLESFERNPEAGGIRGLKVGEMEPTSTSSRIFIMDNCVRKEPFGEDRTTADVGLCVDIDLTDILELANLLFFGKDFLTLRSLA
jgi:hypothetical protein